MLFISKRTLGAPLPSAGVAAQSRLPVGGYGWRLASRPLAITSVFPSPLTDDYPAARRHGGALPWTTWKRLRLDSLAGRGLGGVVRAPPPGRRPTLLAQFAATSGARRAHWCFGAQHREGVGVLCSGMCAATNSSFPLAGSIAALGDAVVSFVFGVACDGPAGDVHGGLCAGVR